MLNIINIIKLSKVLSISFPPFVITKISDNRVGLFSLIYKDRHQVF
jgi:hypothetical protein